MCTKFFSGDGGDLGCVHIHFETIFVDDYQKLTSKLLEGFCSAKSYTCCWVAGKIFSAYDINKVIQKLLVL